MTIGLGRLVQKPFVGSPSRNVVLYTSPNFVHHLPLTMADVQKWLSIKIQRALGLDSPAEAAEIVNQVRSKTDARDIENTLKAR